MSRRLAPLAGVPLAARLGASRRRSRPDVSGVVRALATVPDIVVVDCFGTLLHRRLPSRRVRALAAAAVVEALGSGMDPVELYERRRSIEREWAHQRKLAGRSCDHRLTDLAGALHAELALPCGREDFVDLFCRVEVDTERQLTAPNVELVRALDRHVSPMAVCVLSDTNLTAAMVTELLEAHGAWRSGWSVVTSADAGVTKRSGELYGVALSRRRPGQRVLMIGDDARADGAAARARGLDVELVRPGPWDQRRDVATSALRRRAGKEIARLVLPADPDDVFPELALTLLLFVMRLERSLRASESVQATFLAREGCFLKQLFDRHQAMFGMVGRGPIASGYLLTSRKSTFVAGLRDPARQLPEFVQERRVQGWAELARLLSVPADEVELDVGDDVDAALTDEATLAALRRHQCRQAELLIEHVDAVAPGPAPLDLVDVGWSGTVHDHLSPVLAPRMVRSHLLGFVDRGRPSAGKAGLLFSNAPRSRHYQLFSHFKELYELLLAAAHGSVATYVRDTDGAVGAVFDGDAAEQRAHRELIGPFQARCASRFDALAGALTGVDVADPWLEATVAAHHARMMYRPRRSELDVAERLVQRDNFRPDDVRRPTGAGPLGGPSARGWRRHVAGGGWPPLRMRQAGAGWQRVPYGVYKTFQARRG